MILPDKSITSACLGLGKVYNLHVRIYLTYISLHIRQHTLNKELPATSHEMKLNKESQGKLCLYAVLKDWLQMIL